MSTASRESYAAAAERLTEFSRGADPTSIAAVGDEILAVSDLLGREPRLRRALSEVSRSADDRAGLLSEVLGGNISDEGLALVGELVRGRWSTPNELRGAVERLGVDALLVSADRGGELTDVEDELFRFARVVSGSPQLAAALSDPTADPDRRAELARALLDGKTRAVTVRLVERALRGFGGRSFEGSLPRLIELAAARREREVAYVITAVPLSDDEEQRLAAKLGELYGRDISLKVDVDPSVIGGVRVRVGSHLYDGTLSRRLDEARKALVG
jgi:F-type H+-transporting ATPase subunit delta